MVFVNGVKYACATCIKGHRSSSCNHQDRQLIEIKRKGRPITQCDHCRELRKTHKIHVKCNCKERATNMSTSLDDTSFSNTVDELLNPCQCTTGAKCVCYDPVDDDSSLIENNYSTTHGDSATNSLPSIPSYNQPVVPKKPENCNQPIVPLVFGYRDSSAVFTRSSQSCPSAMASGSCCSTSATESVCRCGTGCNCEGCGTHSLTITPMRPVKNCCSNDSRVVSQYENEIDNDETLMERDVTSVEALLNPCKCLSGSECICCRPIEYIDFNSTSFETSSFTGYQTTMLECKCGAGCQCRGCEKSC